MNEFEILFPVDLVIKNKAVAALRTLVTMDIARIVIRYHGMETYRGYTHAIDSYIFETSELAWLNQDTDIPKDVFKNLELYLIELYLDRLPASDYDGRLTIYPQTGEIEIEHTKIEIKYFEVPKYKVNVYE